MSAPSGQVVALRQLLAERFPAGARPSGRSLAVGPATWDASTRLLPLGAITELVCAAPSCGSHLWLEQLWHSTRQAGQRAALVDATASFDPESYPADLLAHLVWVRCPGVPIALQVTDLLIHDANFAVVVLDLRQAAEAELRRTPDRTWYRLQRAAEPAELAVVALTPRIVVPSAQLRLLLGQSHASAALLRDRPALGTELKPELQRQRLAALAAG